MPNPLSSKQNFKFYKPNPNRDKIEKSPMTEVLEMFEMSTNSLTLANLLVFESVNPTQQFKDKWALRDNPKIG